MSDENSTGSGYTVAPEREAGPAIAAKVGALRQGITYPDRPAGIDIVETHMSWVFLTPRHAYKLKKPVRTDFLDFSTREAREKDCMEELRLNRHLAPDVYLGVVPLVVSSTGSIRLDQPGEVIDWLVKMRRLPAERMMDYLIINTQLKSSEIEDVAILLTGFYRSRTPIPISGIQYRTRLEQMVRTNYQALARTCYGFERPLLETVHDTLLNFIACNAALLDTRAIGNIVEGHGDLRPEHVCLEQPPVIFDCLEFNRQFRIADTADELAFLDMECERLGAPDLGKLLFRTYSGLSGDYPSPSLLLFYKAKSACLRAKLAIWHIHDAERSRQRHWRERAARYLELARGYTLEQRRGLP